MQVWHRTTQSCFCSVQVVIRFLKRVAIFWMKVLDINFWCFVYDNEDHNKISASCSMLCYLRSCLSTCTLINSFHKHSKHQTISIMLVLLCYTLLYYVMLVHTLTTHTNFWKVEGHSTILTLLQFDSCLLNFAILNLIHSH